MGVLGCGRHTVRIVDRFTGHALATPPVAKVQWARRRDEVSVATVQFTKPAGGDCCGQMGDLRSWRHEVEVYRDGVRVWVGPVVRTAETRTRIEVSAADRLAWLGRRVLRGTRSFVDVDPVGIFGAVVHEAIGRYDPIPVRTAFTASVATASLGWSFDQRVFAWAALRDILSTHIDVTMCADVLYAGVTTVPTGSVATLGQQHIAADIEVVEDGSGTATVVHSRGANGLAAAYPPEPEDAPTGDDWWGVIDGVVDRNTETTAADVLDAARAAWRIRRRPPVFINMPSGSRLLPTAPITMDQLIPGAEVTLSITDRRCRPVTGRYEVDSIDVAEGSGSGAARTPGGQFTTASDAATEVVSVSFVPAGATDG